MCTSPLQLRKFEYDYNPGMNRYQNRRKVLKENIENNTYKSQSGGSGPNISRPSGKSSKEDFRVPLNSYSTVKKVIGIISGKGGVGKSFITSYLSVLMNRKGYHIGILDADITGPSIPKAFGIHSKASGNELGILPAVSKEGIKIMSVNLLLETEDTPVIWRGPIIAGTVKQFWSEVLWEDVDYMFVDMPPGTGDVPLTVFQSLPVDGLIIVTSPQELVSMIVSKAVNMANAMNIPILGVIENYSYVKCGNCGEKISVFGISHIDEIAEKFKLPVLGKVPIDPAIAAAVDEEKVEDLKGDWINPAVETIETVHMVKNRETHTAAEVITAAGKKTATVKIAVAVDDNNNVSGHFDKSEKINIYEICGDELIGKTGVSTKENGRFELASRLAEQKVNVLICGEIGMDAIEDLKDTGILIIPDTKGDAEVVTAAYLDTSLGNAPAGR